MSACGTAISITPDLHSVPVMDAAMQASLQPWVEMECYQLSHGQQVCWMDTLDFGQLQLVQERQLATVHKMGSVPKDLCTISWSTHDPALRFSEHAAGNDDTAFFMPANIEYDIHVPAGCKTIYASFSQEEFLAAARLLDPRHWEKPVDSVAPIRTTQAAQFKQTVEGWFDSVVAATVRGDSINPQIMRASLFQTFLQIATASTQDDPVPSVTDRARALQLGRMARAYAESRFDLGELPGIDDICAFVGVSERTLQYAFREYVGMSPVAYLRRCRLNRARSVLKASDPRTTTVTQVAMRFGFLHLGRFAADYGQLFHQPPSATLGA